MKVTGLLGKLAKPILDKYQEARPQQGDRTLKEETFDIAGVSYYLDNLQKLACANPDYRKRGKTLAEEGQAGKRIYRYNYVYKPVKLILEGKNPHDRYAVMVQIAGEKVGYISQDQNRHVREILSKHEVKFISARISGGEYKVIAENGDTEKDSKRNYITVKIAYV